MTRYGLDVLLFLFGTSLFFHDPVSILHFQKGNWTSKRLVYLISVQGDSAWKWSLSLGSTSRSLLMHALPMITPCASFTLSVSQNKWPSYTLLSSWVLSSPGSDIPTLGALSLILQSSALHEMAPTAARGWGGRGHVRGKSFSAMTAMTRTTGTSSLKLRIWTEFLSGWPVHWCKWSVTSPLLVLLSISPFMSVKYLPYILRCSYVGYIHLQLLYLLFGLIPWSLCYILYFSLFCLI